MTPWNLSDWMIRWRVAPEAMMELRLGLAEADPSIYVPSEPSKAESRVQSEVRLAASYAGGILWRNNVGVLKNPYGVPVRYGLANDSPQVNRVLKSSDLIGLKPVTVTPIMVGTVIGQFWARECKREDWVWRATDAEQAQAAFINRVQTLGGDAAFATGPGSI